MLQRKLPTVSGYSFYIGNNKYWCQGFWYKVHVQNFLQVYVTQRTRAHPSPVYAFAEFQFFPSLSRDPPLQTKIFLISCVFGKKLESHMLWSSQGSAHAPKPGSVPIKNYFWIKKAFIKFLQKYVKNKLLHNDDNSNNNHKQFMIVSQDSFQHYTK